MDLVFQGMGGAPQEIEIVERKGTGHPDTICDALAEAFGTALCRFYLDRFGEILHHNVDKALLWGGAARPAFGGGEVVTPMEIFLSGRATRKVRGVEVPVEEIAVETSRAWLREHVHAIDPERHARVHCLVRQGSDDLQDLFVGQRGAVVLANDTSIGAGYAPLSDLEEVVLAASRAAEALARAEGAGEVGEDVKVMGVRQGRRIDLTVCCAFVGRFLRDLGAYRDRRAALAQHLAGTARALCPGHEVTVAVNAADDDRSGRVYLTVTGTSAEAGDDGQVGRGNRVNGLITPYRPMTLEAAAGKNPISHVGKLYNVAAHRIAADLVREVPGVAEAQVFLVSQIGRRIDDPAVADVRLLAREGTSVEALSGRVEPIVRAEVAEVGALWRSIVRGEVPLF